MIPSVRYNIDMIRLKMEGSAVLLPIKAVPGASRTRILGEWQGRLRVAVAAAPQRGKANAELIAFLAKKLGLRKSDLTVIAGETSPLKTIAVEGTTPAAILTALKPPTASPDKE